MKPHTLPVKRNPVSKGVFKRLSAVTRSRKQRVAATADGEFDDDDHSSKISRALTIIFLIHIVVIGLIFFHKKFLDDGTPQATTAQKVSPAPQRNAQTLPKLSNGDTVYRVLAGDNYDRIALRQEVDVTELRAMNNNVEITPGRVLKIPPKRIIAVDPPELAAIRENTPSDSDRGLVEVAPVSPSGGAPRAQPVTDPDGLVAVEPPSAPVVAKPKTTPPAPPRATAVPAAATAAPAVAKSSAKTYVVKSGDNVWRIANRFNVDQKALMKANGITDPKKLKLGASLKIPQ